METALLRNIEVRTLLTGRKNLNAQVLWKADVDGLIIVYPITEDIDRIVELKNTPIPILMVNLLNPDLIPSYNCTNLNYEICGVKTVDYLFKKGHRKVLFFSEYPLIKDGHAVRLLNGYMSEMKRLSLEPVTIIEKKCHSGNAEQLFKKFKKEIISSNAIFTAHRTDGPKLHQFITKTGRRIPEDIALISYEDTLDAEKRKITTWTIPWKIFGSEIISHFERLYFNPGKQRVLKKVKLKLVERKSA